MKLNRQIARLVAAAALFAGSHDAHAIGDSGGCSMDSQYERTLSLGTVAEIESHVASTIARNEKYLDLKQKLAFVAKPSLLKAWRDDARVKMLNGPLACSTGFPLDLAVGHGNLDVVRWLLDSGADPSARSADGKQNVFTRCSSGGYGAPVGISKEQAFERRLEAYRLLLARGADVNALDPFQRIGGCMNSEMHPLLKQLGARVTREAFVSWVSDARSGESIYDRTWAAVEQLAKWQAFDFRGTSFEESLLSMLDARANMSDYNAVVELTRRLTTIVRLSPGIVPGQPARPEDVPAEFAATRERCYFPEINAYPNFEFQALWRDAASGQRGSSAPDTTEVRVGKTKAPVLLALFNRDVPTTWKISRSSDAHILGVMVLRDTLGGHGSNDALSFDPLRSAFLGDSSYCAVLVVSQRNREPRNRLEPYWPANSATRSFNPFRLRGEPAIAVSQGNQFAVGEIPASAAMTSWPDDRREMPVSKK